MLKRSCTKIVALRQPHLIIAIVLAMVVLAVSVVCTGCQSSEDSTSETPPWLSGTIPTDYHNIPSKARYDKINLGVPLQSSDITALVRENAASDADIVALTQYLRDQGYSVDLNRAHYRTATNEKGIYLIGFTLREIKSDGTVGTLVGFFTIPGATNMSRLFAYAAQHNYSPNAKPRSFSVLVWAEDDVLRSIEGP